jgi:hypothetical protein
VPEPAGGTFAGRGERGQADQRGVGLIGVVCGPIAGEVFESTREALITADDLNSSADLASELAE